jgi:crossover junction endodeoxyribonuclease RuvC
VRVLGIDPGLGRTGVAVVDGRPGAMELVHLECLETSSDLPDPARLHLLQRILSTALERWRPEACAVERLFFSSNRTTAMRVSEARGVILASLAATSVSIAEYTPTEVKEAVAGYGAARKPQVMRMCARLLGEAAVSEGDDAADAVAVAVCHHHRAGLGSVRTLTGSRATPALEAAVAAARRRLEARP